MKAIVEQEEKEALSRLMGSLSVFKILKETMPLQYVLTFLAVATDEGKSVREYARRLGVNNTTMSRHLLDIGPRNRQMQEGYNLISYRANPLELRKHEYYITPKGKTLIRQILKELQA